MSCDYPIMEYDGEESAVIEPSRYIQKHENMPERVVMCFFREVIEQVCAGAPVAATLKSEVGPNPIYVIEHEGHEVAVMHPGVGAPLAVGFLEETIALGGRRFIACGGAGVLRPEIVVGHVVVPTGAVRDEGTSYHYLPAAHEVGPDPLMVEAIETVLKRREVPYNTGKTWTTDAVYRETPGRVGRRRDRGCLTVEMEASAFFAAAIYRGVPFGQLLYGGDDVSGDEWDHRGWDRHGAREGLFWLAVEALIEFDQAGM